MSGIHNELRPATATLCCIWAAVRIAASSPQAEDACWQCASLCEVLHNKICIIMHKSILFLTKDSYLQ
jgi:hypothetical protein